MVQNTTERHICHESTTPCTTISQAKLFSKKKTELENAEIKS